jgi:hypothetical protein
MEKVKKQVTQKLSDAQRIEFAKQIEMLYEAAHADFKKVFTLSLLKGIATGLGVFLGGTIVVGVLLWILSLGSHVPFVGRISQSAEKSIQQTKQQDQNTKAH